MAMDFSGAGFPGDGGHTAVEINFQFTNDKAKLLMVS